MNVFKLWELSEEEKNALLYRTEVDASELSEAVRPIIEEIREHGDTAVVKYTKKFEGADIPVDQLKVIPEEFQEAYRLVDPNVRAAIEKSARNIKAFHELQKPESYWIKEIAPGVFAGEQTTPIDAVALSVPRGKGSFPSVMLMIGIPAVVAGVESIHVFTPPLADGTHGPGLRGAGALDRRAEGHRHGGVRRVPHAGALPRRARPGSGAPPQAVGAAERGRAAADPLLGVVAAPHRPRTLAHDRAGGPLG